MSEELLVPVQLSFSLLAFPCVLLQYMGQTAYLIHHPDQYVNAFWSAVPKAVFWPLLVVGTLAAIVASQVRHSHIHVLASGLLP